MPIHFRYYKKYSRKEHHKKLKKLNNFFVILKTLYYITDPNSKIFIKKEAPIQVFFCGFCEILKNS